MNPAFFVFLFGFSGYGRAIGCRGFVLAAGRTSAALRLRLHGSGGGAGHPGRRPATAATPSAREAFETNDRFFKLLPLLA
jgi:hypothetical protein